MPKCEKCGKEGNSFELRKYNLSLGVDKVLCKKCYAETPKEERKDILKKKEQTKFGILSVVLGALGLISFYLLISISYGMFIEFSLGISAIILGIIATNKRDELGYIGLLLGIITLIFPVFMLGMFAGMA